MIIYNKIFQNIIKEVSNNLNIPEEVILMAYTKKWEFIRENIENLQLIGNMNEEEFLNIKSSFNLPSLGKIYTTFDKVEKINNKLNYIKKLRNDKSIKDKKD